MDKFLKFFPLVKVDEAQRLVYGLVTAERVDKDGETCEYASTKPQYEKVNAEIAKMSGGENIMPLREMHQLHAVGAGKSIEFDDAKKEIHMAFKVVEDSTWKKVCEKVLLGFSQGGRYLKRWKEGDTTFYTAEPGEVSLVDNPCLSGAVIEYVKADGSIESIVPIVKQPDVSELSTRVEKLSTLVDDLVSKHSAAKGGPMKPEEIKKCAAALGITEEEFTKRLEESMVKAKGLAALHSHLEALHAHHTAHHEAMSKAHDAHTAHIEKCMKACKGVMGSDEKEADKALKALLDEMGVKKIEETKPNVEGMVKAEDMTKAIADAVGAATEKLTKDFQEKLDKSLATDNGGTGGAHLALVGRDGKVISKASDARNPMAVD